MCYEVIRLGVALTIPEEELNSPSSLRDEAGRNDAEYMVNAI